MHPVQAIYPGQTAIKIVENDPSLSNTTLKGADLRQANFTRADLREANFKEAQMENVCFGSCRVRDALFTSVSGLSLAQRDWLRENGALNVE